MMTITTTTGTTRAAAKAFSSKSSTRRWKKTTTGMAPAIIISNFDGAKKKTFSTTTMRRRGPNPTPAVVNGASKTTKKNNTTTTTTKTTDDDAPKNLERVRISTPWEEAQEVLQSEFGTSEEDLKRFGEVSKDELENAYEMMQLCRDFENECNQSYMGGKIRGFMHLDNGQESIPALLANSIRKSDLKHSYYRDHCHAIACGVDSGKVMAELYGRDGGTCRGTGGSMHIYDVENNFQGGWALVSEQLPTWLGGAIDRLG